jgi:hypothetical protein
MSKAARKSAAAPKTITQAEIQALINQDAQVQRTAYDFRKRMFAGATFESGPLSLKNDAALSLEESLSDPWNFELAGLRVSRADPETFTVSLPIALRDLIDEHIRTTSNAA